MSDARVSVSIEEHVAVVTLTRPDKHNALDLAMLDAIIAAAERLRTEAGVRAVVLHGAGKSFCSGSTSGRGRSRRTRGLHRVLDDPPPNYFQRSAYGDPGAGAGDRGDSGNCFGGASRSRWRRTFGSQPGRPLSVMEGRWD